MDRFKQMKDFFITRGGRCIATVDGPNGSELFFWSIDGKVFISQYWKDDGWSHWLPSNTNNIVLAMNEMDRFLSAKPQNVN